MTISVYQTSGDLTRRYFMWPFGMSRREMERFLREYSDELISILLDAYGMTVDEIVMEHMSEEAQDWAGDYWEAC